MLFDPNAPTPADPRPNTPTFWYASGMRRLLARTDWSENAAWLTYNLSWNRVDHQSGNGNGFEFYRNGEWLTKTRVGYDFDYHSSDNMNTLTVQNDPIDRDDFRLMLWERGSQWLYSAGDAPQPTYSYTDDYLYIFGDSTNLYNSEYEGLMGIAHVSREIVWLKPDVIVVYDRAVTNADNRPKRFMLNFPAAATINGKLVTMTTDSGQNLFLTSLLPADASIAVNELQDEVSSSPAHFEFVTHRLEINGGGAANMRFLTVLEGADAGATAATATLIPCGDAYEGALVGATLVLFAQEANTDFSGLNCALPAGVATVYLTGLTANTGYDVTIAADSLSVATGSAYTSDSSGVVRASTAQ